MSQEDNIKNFFQSRLKESSPEEAGWNIPSDDIWESAKVHFPKEDKSRRPYLLLLSGLVGLILIGILAYSQLSSNQELILSESDITTETTDDKKTANQKNISNQTIEQESYTTNINKDINTSREQKSKSTLASTNNISNQINNKPIINKSAVSQTLDSEIQTETTKKGNTVFATTINEKTISFLSDESLSNKTESANDIAEVTNNKSKDSAISKANTLAADSANNIADGPNNIDLVQLNIISALPIELLTYDMAKDLSANHIITPIKSDKKWEIGLTTSPLILPLERLIKEDAADEGINDVDLKYIGLNIPITRIINPKWSITSGFYYKKGSLRVSFEEEETLDIGDNISMMFNDNSSVASISLQDQTEEITVNLKPDAQIIDGEVLSVKGNGLVDFNVFQVPLLGNYHIRKNRFEYIFSLGASIDFARIAINEFDITLAQQNRIITEPIKYTPLSVDLIEYSLYAGVGTKFHLNESINLSYGIKSDLTAVFLTTHEIGLHYRF